MASVGLAGCVGNDDGDDDDLSVTLIDLTQATTTDCPDGGTTIYTGLDDDNDGVLETDERDTTFHACNGADGSNGVDGADGSNGADGADGADGSNG
ncbi:MAG: DUF7151 family protein, partial [Candidatus Poseidoniaceae archaeon]